MLKINWNTVANTPRRLYFTDLALTEGFKNAGHLSKNAVYMKVVDKDDNYQMLEVATGRLWRPTEAPVERVPLELNVQAPKPSIY